MTTRSSSTTSASIHWETEGSSVNLETAEVQVHWPSIDKRPGYLRRVTREMEQALTQAFLAGYRAAQPDATPQQMTESVLRWASG